MISAQGLRRAVKNWFGSLEPQLYVTHNFGYRVSPETGERSLRRFYNRMQRQVHGRNWSRRYDDAPMVAVGFWEHLDSNPHCHVLVAGADREYSWLLHEGSESWLWAQPRGQLEVVRILQPRAAISYITKELYKPDSQDQLFIYQAPLSNSPA
jgi:hypothetical protein